MSIHTLSRLLMLSIALLVLAPAALAQSDFGESPPVDPPKMQLPGDGSGDVELEFCDGDVCPGQTCDEVNDRCVGNVTLQPGMGEPLAQLRTGERNRFFAGKDDFELNFTDDTGLGPVFNQTSCASCHNTPVGGSGTIKVVRFGETDFQTNEFDPLAELGGSLWNRESLSPECAEVIPFPPANTFAERLTNSTLGFGLVEAIADADIEANAITPPPGVSGRVHIVPILEEPGMTAVGRFGWKSQLATVMSFSADASLQEMGITSSVFPEDNPPNNDLDLLAACDTAGDPETIPDANGVEFIDRITDFQRFLAPPPQTPRSGMTGEAVFESIGCADCHVATFAARLSTEDDELEDAISGRTLHPYSDFLLHDMGGSGDGIEQGGAGMTELRTVPLWGLRVRDPLWHDGRVGGGTFTGRMSQVIQTHDATGSEAQASAQAFAALDQADKDALFLFMDSLGRREFDHDGDGDVDEDDTAAFEACYTGPGSFYTPDDHCSISDVDQDGDVDDDDLELHLVALGTVVDTGDDDGDEDGDDDNSSHADSPVQPGGGGFQDLGPGGGDTAGGQETLGGTESAQPEERRRNERRKPSRVRQAHRGR